MKKLLAFLLFGLLLTPSTLAAPAAADLLTIAADAMQQADNAEDEDSRRDALQRALAAYRTIETEHGRTSEALHVAAGAAAMLLEDLGRAVLEYRRALQIDPTSDRAAAGLEAARALVGVSTPRSVGSRVASAMQSWKAWVRPRWVFWTAAGAWLAFFLCWSARVGLAWRVPRWPAAAAAVLAGGLLIIDAAFEARPAGVVTEGNVVARTGPGDALYDPAFSQPLEPGVEFRVIERAGEWWRVDLGAIGDGWIRADQAELVTHTKN